jgi:hypothetical protein
MANIKTEYSAILRLKLSKSAMIFNNNMGKFNTKLKTIKNIINEANHCQSLNFGLVSSLDVCDNQISRWSTQS